MHSPASDNRNEEESIIRYYRHILASFISFVSIFATAAPILADQRREDIAQFRTEFFAKDRSYSPAARAEAERRLVELERADVDMKPAAFDLEIARIVALADNGHTASFEGPRSRRYDRVELRLTPFGEDFYVLRAQEKYADLLGAKLIAIDGVTIDKLRPRYRALKGGVARWRDRGAAYFLESPEQLRADGVVTEPGELSYRFTLRDGTLVERKLTATAGGTARAPGNAARWMNPEFADIEGNAWRSLLPVDNVPWSLQEPTKVFRWRMDVAQNAIIVEMRQTSNAKEEKLADFFRAVEAAIETHKPANLVVDLRLNGGGDLTTTRDFAERLPTLIPGRIFILTSPWTFSAAISTAGYLKQAAPMRTTVVGEAIGDTLNFFAEGKSVTLKHSREVVLYATERHDYQTGCRAFKDCHGQVVGRPITVTSLDPDIAAPWTIAAYRAGRDPAMDAVATALQKK